MLKWRTSFFWRGVLVTLFSFMDFHATEGFLVTSAFGQVEAKDPEETKQPVGWQRCQDFSRSFACFGEAERLFVYRACVKGNS